MKVIICTTIGLAVLANSTTEIILVDKQCSSVVNLYFSTPIEVLEEPLFQQPQFYPVIARLGVELIGICSLLLWLRTWQHTSEPP